MKKQTLLRLMIGLVLILSLVGCKTTAPEEPVVEVPVKVETEVVKPAPKPEPEPKPEPKPVVVEEAVVEEVVEEPVVEEVVVDDINIKVIATSDINGMLFPNNFVTGRAADTSLAQIYSFVAEERGDKSQGVVLLDAGNVMQGQLIVDYYNYLKPANEHIVPAVMNAMGYDAAVPGADDAAMGAELLYQIGAASAFPWIGANVVSAQTGKAFKGFAYTVIEENGVKIAILGLTSSSIEAPQGIKVEDMVTTAKKWIPIIESRENPDMIIALCQSEGSDEGVKVAEMVRGIDLVIAGTKTVKALNPDGETVYVVGAMEDAKSVATADVTLSWDKNADGFAVSNVKARSQSMASYPVSKDAMGAFSYAVDELKAAVMTKIGYLNGDVDANDALFGDSAMVDILHTLQLQMTGADISFAAPPVVNVTLRKGPITVRDALYVMEAFGLESGQTWLYTGEMTGAEIDAYLEYSYANWFNEMGSVNDNLLGGLDYYNFDSAAGIKYVVDVKKAPGKKVNIKTTTADGLKFQKAQTYTVVMNAYRAFDYGKFLSKGVGLSSNEIASRVQSSFSVNLLQGFTMGEDMLGTVNAEADDNWFASPRFWAQKGMETDMKLLK